MSCVAWGASRTREQRAFDQQTSTRGPAHKICFGLVEKASHAGEGCFADAGKGRRGIRFLEGEDRGGPVCMNKSCAAPADKRNVPESWKISFQIIPGEKKLEQSAEKTQFACAESLISSSSQR